VGARANASSSPEVAASLETEEINDMQTPQMGEIIFC